MQECIREGQLNAASKASFWSNRREASCIRIAKTTAYSRLRGQCSPWYGPNLHNTVAGTWYSICILLNSGMLVLLLEVALMARKRKCRC